MKRFIIKTISFHIVLIALYATIYISFKAYLNGSYSNNEAVFIWGDSQAYQGIDIHELSNTLKKEVYTSAQHGAGVYDFLIFTEQVPEKSKIIVSISKLAQIRRKENDYNRSGLSIWALQKLYENNYSKKEIISIIKQNIPIRRNIRESTELYAYSDSMQIKLPLSLFESYYQKIPTFLEEKQNLYIIGIKNLIKKNCKIVFIEFPFHKELEIVEDLSPIKMKTNKFIYQIGSLFDEFEVKAIKLNKDKNIFADLSHLNSFGAKDLSKKLGENILKNEHTTIYIAR